MNPTLTRAQWLEQMYDNRALVPDSPAYLERWARESAQVRTEGPCVLDQAYGGGQGETLDIFPPAAASTQGAPVLVFIHGGYWRALDKADHSFVAPPFVQAGVCVVVVNYALCPGTAQNPVGIAHIEAQMDRALAWIGQHIAPYGGDPARVTVAGHSAGGQLAAMLLARAHCGTDNAALPVRNALSISGLHDLEPLMHTPMYQATLQLTPELVERHSPARLAAPGQGVLYCAVGGNESPEFLRQNALMQEAWGCGAVPVSEALPGLHHFSIVNALAEPGHALHRRALELLRA